MSLAHLFPGQGSQHPGMGRGLFERFPDLAAQADRILGESIERLCVSNPDDKLSNTAHAQPALFVVNALAHLARLQDEPRQPSFYAGHSLGEYNALWAAGVFDFETGLRLVRKRGELMSQASGGGMAAVIGMPADDLKRAISDFAFDTLDVANYNARLQTVISGPRRDIEDFAAVFEEIKDCRYVVLKVSGAFHSRYMKASEAAFERELAAVEMRPSRIPVISNRHARPYPASPAEMRSVLASQISHSVRWRDSMAHLREAGCTEFREVGPGRVLTGLLKMDADANANASSGVVSGTGS